MESKNLIVGVALFFLFVMLGGCAGIFVGYSFSQNSQPVYSLQKIEETERSDEQKANLADVQKNIDPIEIDGLEDLNHVLEIWKKIMCQTANQEMDKKEAVEKLYDLSTETYNRNLPKSASLYRIKNILLNSGKENFKDFIYSSIDYDGENIAYVHVKEIYQNNEYSYILKFIREKNEWGFAAQLKERGI